MKISRFTVIYIFHVYIVVDVDKNECKSYQAHKVNQYQTYEIVWQGSSIKDCGVGFYAKGDGFFSIDHYKICVKPVVWNMSDCTSQLYLNYNRAKVLD